MTLEEVARNRNRLGTQKLSTLRKECGQSNHNWKDSKTNVPQKYCAHCYLIQGEHGARL